MEIQNIEQQIKELKQELEELKEMLEENKQRLEDFDLSEEYEEMLDESNPELFNMRPSYILKEMDEVMYNCGLADYEDEQRSELESDIQSEEEQIKDLEDQILDLEAIQDAKEENEEVL